MRDDMRLFMTTISEETIVKFLKSLTSSELRDVLEYVDCCDKPVQDIWFGCWGRITAEMI